LLSRRVPNILVLLMLVCGVVVQIATAPTIGEALLASFAGAGVGLIILLPFYTLGGMGAGDVKLLAATGSFLGPQGALLAGVFTLVAGLILGLLVIAYRRFGASSPARRLAGDPQGGSSAIQFPYSLAVSAGALTAVMQW